MNKLFFFSSRRRHTRWPRNWSSDVCSSDLALTAALLAATEALAAASAALDLGGLGRGISQCRADLVDIELDGGAVVAQIGRASCRERGLLCVVERAQKSKFMYEKRGGEAEE